MLLDVLGQLILELFLLIFLGALVLLTTFICAIFMPMVIQCTVLVHFTVIKLCAELLCQVGSW